jgi:phosphoribosylglycinamide formyltransferase 1
MTFRVAVLASGSGSNFEALCHALNSPHQLAHIALLICNVPNAGVLVRAEKLGVPHVVLTPGDFASRMAFDEAILKVLQDNKIEAVCLAGYMRLVGPVLTRAFRGKMLNIHPALLPSFPGLHAVRQAIEKRVKISGCTVHFVDEGIDTGPIISQASVEVFDTDTEETLAARILQKEHKLYAQAIEGLASGRICLGAQGTEFKEPHE